MSDEILENEEQEDEGDGNWWKGFFTLMLFMGMIITIVSLVIYGIFFHSKKEETPTPPKKEDSSPPSDSDSNSPDSKGFFSNMFSFFKSSSDEVKSEEKQVESSDSEENISDNVSKNESEKIPEVKKELSIYWSESNEKIVQLEQTINDVVAIVIKTFPPQIQPIENKEVLSTPSVNIGDTAVEESPVHLGESPVLETAESVESTDFNGTWVDVGNQLIKLEEGREKVITALSK